MNSEDTKQEGVADELDTLTEQADELNVPAEQVDELDIPAEQADELDIPAEEAEAIPDEQDAEATLDEPAADVADAADAADATSEDIETATPDSPQQEKRAKLGTGAWVAITAVALVAGLVIGANVIGGNGPSPVGKTAVAEADLDTPIATYTYDGNRHDLTIRDSIVMSTPLEAAKNSEGNYAIPSVDNIVNLARNSVLMEEAVKRNLSASDEEVAKYAEQNVGSSDYAALAKQYSLDEAEVKDMLKNSCTLNKLQTTVMEEIVGKAPEEPKAPKDVDKDGDKTSAEYAEYIIKLVGNEWNADKGTWASEDSMYAQVLKDYKIKADSASYNAAKKAYDTAYQVYSSSANSAWNDYLGGLLNNTSIQIRTIAS